MKLKETFALSTCCYHISFAISITAGDDQYVTNYDDDVNNNNNNNHNNDNNDINNDNNNNNSN